MDISSGQLQNIAGKNGIIDNKILKGHVLFPISSTMQMSIFFSNCVFVKGKNMTENFIYTNLLYQE